MSDQSDSFQDLAQCLTGFGPEHMSVALEDFDFRAAMEGYVGKDWVSRLVGLYAELKAAGEGDDRIAGKILNDAPDPKLSALARAMIKLLYMGIWLQPYDHEEDGRLYKAADPPGYTAGYPPTVVSSTAYAAGLVWKAMQAHAPGVSHDLVGSWERPPRPLKDFVT